MKPLTPERWRQVQEVLDDFDDLPEAERPGLLARIRRADPALADDVEPFLENDDILDGFLEKPLFGVCSESLDDAVLVPRIGPYRLVRELGEGGMGTVYLATQEEPFRRQVALKLIRPEAYSRDTVRRFESERAILARIRHPNVAHLYDGGTTPDGRPYFVMEYVEGKPVEEYCDVHGLSARERLELFAQVCSAVHLAHQKLRVVHRDLKPGNVLVTADGTAKLLDFGVARPFDGDFESADPAAGRAVSVWTPDYSSPEQLAGLPLTTASDVYSLGVLLYRLLTGRLPYGLGAARPEEALRTIRGQEPARPGLGGDLDAIVLKALAKEPESRYSSVERLVADVRCYLSGLPVLARAPTFPYVAGKFVRRHWLRLTAAAAIVVLACGLIVFQAREITRERRASAQVRRISASLGELLKALQPATPNQKVEIEEALEKAEHIVSDSMFADYPLEQTLLMDAMGLTYATLKDYGKAEALLEEALESRRRALGGDHLLVAESLSNLGLYRWRTGDLEKAEVHLREALRIHDQSAEPDAGERSKVMTNLGLVLYDQKRHADAEALFRQVLDMRRHLDDDHPGVVLARNNLASALMQQGAYATAESLYRQNLEVRLELYGAEHKDVATSRNQLATVLYYQNELEAAETEVREALRIRREVYGPGHVNVGPVLNNLGRILQAKGELREAEEACRQALTLLSGQLKDDHVHVVAARKSLAEVRDALRAGGGPEAAAPYRQNRGEKSHP